MGATFKIKDFNKYEKVISQFLSKGKNIFNIVGFKIEFKKGSMIMYYNEQTARASYVIPCQHDIKNKIISTDYFKFSQVLKALAVEGAEEIFFELEEKDMANIIKIDTPLIHIDIPAFEYMEEFDKKLTYSEDDITCTFDDIELYNATKIAASFLPSDIGVSVFVNDSAISNTDRYIYVAKKKWGFELPEVISLSKQNLDTFNSLKTIDSNATYRHITSDKLFVHMASEDSTFNMQVTEPTPVQVAPTDEDLERISSTTFLTEIVASELLTIINFFLSTGIFDGQRLFPLTIQTFPKDKKIKFTVLNTQNASVPSLNIERWLENIDDLSVKIDAAISADILKIFLDMVEKTSKIKIYTAPDSNGIKFETLDQDLFLAKFS